MRTIGFYVQNLPQRRVRDMLITVEGRVVPADMVKKGEGSMDTMLLFDLETAWNSMNLAAPWSGEVNVVLSLR